MAKKSAAGDKPKAQKAKTKTQKAKAKSAKSDAPNSEKKAKKGKAGKAKSAGGSPSAADALFKLAEHPIVADLIAVGATAAVAAIVKSKSDKSRHAVKDAGKAAASAIGARLVEEFKAVKEAANKAAKEG